MPGAAAVARAKVRCDDACAGHLRQRCRPGALERFVAGRIPNAHARGHCAQVIHVPVGPHHGCQMMAQPPAQATRPMRAAHVKMKPRRKIKAPEAADGDLARPAMVQQELVQVRERNYYANAIRLSNVEAFIACIDHFLQSMSTLLRDVSAVGQVQRSGSTRMLSQNACISEPTELLLARHIAISPVASSSSRVRRTIRTCPWTSRCPWLRPASSLISKPNHFSIRRSAVEWRSRRVDYVCPHPGIAHLARRGNGASRTRRPRRSVLVRKRTMSSVARAYETPQDVKLLKMLWLSISEKLSYRR